MALSPLLEAMSPTAHALFKSDRQWAKAANLPPETLSRLRKRESCDFRTLQALAAAAGMRLTPTRSLDESGDFGREDEDHLLDLCASGNADPRVWKAFGDTFLTAGVAMMLASARDFDRSKYMRLAEELHPGMSLSEVFDRWLKRTRLNPARFLPLVRHRKQVAA